LDIDEVGRDTKMPWEAAGRQWHTVDRVGRQGEPCKWDGQIVARVVDRIHELDTFSPTNWNSRTIVEIAAERKTDGWFLHAITGEQWVVKLKFRVAKKTFQREKLIERLALTPFNELPELPVYGDQPRVKCKNLRGPWQEIELAVHSLAEIDKPEFWQFLEAAAAGFRRLTDRVAQNPEDLMPWKVLGQKWHFSRRGFPPGKKVEWPAELLEELCELLSETAPDGQFLWNNQQVVHMFVPKQTEPWASVYTKRVAGLDLVLNGPKARFAFGRVAALAAHRELVTDDAQRDTVKLRFGSAEDLQVGNLSEFLSEHYAAVCGKAVPKLPSLT
jgi:excinuclease ABC subunit A